MGRWERSRTATGRERKSRWVIGMLVQRRVMPRWGNDLMGKLKMVGIRKSGRAREYV